MRLFTALLLKSFKRQITLRKAIVAGAVTNFLFGERFGGKRRLVVDFAEDHPVTNVVGADTVVRDRLRVTFECGRSEVTASTLLGHSLPISLAGSGGQGSGYRRYRYEILRRRSVGGIIKAETISPGTVTKIAAL